MDKEKSQDPEPTASSATRPHARRLVLVALVALVAGISLGGTGVWLALHLHGSFGSSTPAAQAVKQAPLYQCPMHPAITSDHPGDCPICGMKLVLIAAAATTTTKSDTKGDSQVAGLASVTIDPARQQLIGLRTIAVSKGPIGATWRTAARVQVDPTRVRQTNVKVEGFVERIFVDFVGQEVRKGQPLFSLYSPTLLAAQSEFLLALQTKEALAKGGALTENGTSLVEAARRRLELWDVPPSEIDKLQRTRQPTKTLTLVSPIAGVVTAKNVVQGGRLTPGQAPYEITDLGMVWVMADAYETDLDRIRVGMKATMTLSAYPNRTFPGQVGFIDPILDPKTRTTKVHLHFANPKRELKPEMYGEVTLGGAAKEGLRIPIDAVIHAGSKDVVFVARGEGRFEPRVVQLGSKSGDEVEVTGGLEQGQEVVMRANFLVDSESQLRASLSAIGGH